MQHLENDLDQTLDKLQSSTTSKDLEEASDRTNAIAKAIKILESKNMIDEGRIDMLEGQVKEAKQMVEESDIKYDEVARKLAMV